MYLFTIKQYEFRTVHKDFVVIPYQLYMRREEITT